MSRKRTRILSTIVDAAASGNVQRGIIVDSAMTTLTHLECSQCAKTFEKNRLYQRCSCGGALLARFDLEKARQSWNRAWIQNAASTMWRYQPVLPVARPDSFVSMGEGYTPLVRTARLGSLASDSQLWIKDDKLSPSGSVRAREMSCAVSMARELGVRALAIPSAGGAGATLGAYAAAAGLEAHVVMPRQTYSRHRLACLASGARVTLLDGNIADCVNYVAERAASDGWYDLSPFHEPYRLEGAKTTGYELAEQFHWNPPDAVLCPTGAGLTIAGIWKSLEEMEQLGWITPNRPKLIAVQASGCRPYVDAIQENAERCRPWTEPRTAAAAFRFGASPADSLVLSAIRQSGGTAVAVEDQEMIDAGIEMAATAGMFPALEGAACLVALRRLLVEGFLKAEERIVLLNPASGTACLEAYASRFPSGSGGETDKLGGLITPR